MKNLTKIISIVLAIILININSLPIEPANAWTYVDEIRYWSDSDIYEADTDTSSGGSASTRASDLDDLGVYVSTTSALQDTYAWIYISNYGAHGGSGDEWNLPETTNYIVKVYWYFQGEFDGDGSNYFKFFYQLLHYDSGIVVDTDYTKEYTTTVTYSSVTSICHTIDSSVSLDSSIDYYLRCKITVNHHYYDGSSKTDFTNQSPFDYEIDFLYAMFTYKDY